MRNKNSIITILVIAISLVIMFVSQTWGELITPTTPITVGGTSVYRDGNQGLPDSVQIVTNYEGSAVYSAWFNTGDAECYSSNGSLFFTDTFSDIDGSGGDGHYLVMARCATDSTVDIFDEYYYSYTIGFVDTMAYYVWEEILTGGTHNTDNSAGRRLRAIGSGVISDGTGRGAPDGITFLLATAEAEADDFYNGHLLKIITGTGIHQERLIEDYTGATDSVTLHEGDDWTTNPVNTDDYEIVGGHAKEVVHIHDVAINDVVLTMLNYLMTDWGDSTVEKFGKLLHDAGDSSNYLSADSLGLMFAIAAFNDGYYTRTNYHADADSVYIISMAHDTIGYHKYFHPGGTAGDPPDSIIWTDY